MTDDSTNQRRNELTIAALRAALADAVREIDEHNSEYEHVTQANKIDNWRRLASGDVLAETFARLDLFGSDARLGPTDTIDAALRAQYDLGELSASALSDTLGAFSDVRRHFVTEVPRWENDGGAPAGDGWSDDDAQADTATTY